MPRYIDADKLKTRIAPECDFRNTLVEWIDLQETEDVEPVVHAHWIEEEDCTAVTDIPWSMCSACGSYSLKLPYCAFCGAKMDEE